MDLVASEFYWR
jgi:hypothetical protein